MMMKTLNRQGDDAYVLIAFLSLSPSSPRLNEDEENQEDREGVSRRI